MEVMIYELCLHSQALDETGGLVRNAVASRQTLQWRVRPSRGLMSQQMKSLDGRSRSVECRRCAPGGCEAELSEAGAFFSYLLSALEPETPAKCQLGSCQIVRCVLSPLKYLVECIFDCHNSAPAG